ncbi:MAG: ABC transporter substrate-binding protein [Deltaproteobacteria bacterium]|nr:ABC transporter substrate-binding protein [Deltaproteobacteria bacterium]MBI3075797.1 ABC transporter substrate-binding protein [Deltaproteobacteria bacterium]
MTRLVMVFMTVALVFEPSWALAKERLKVIYSAVSGVYAGFWVARAAEVFDRHGLSVELIYVPSASKVVQAMLGGESPVAGGGGKPVVDADLAGADLVIFGGVVNVPAFYLIARPEIRSVQELKGKPVGVSRIGSSSDFTMRYVLKKFGLEPDRDVPILQMGGMMEIGIGIAQGVIVAGTLSSPSNLPALKAGARVLVDMGKAGVAFPHTALLTRRSYLKTNEDVVRRFLKGYAEAVHLVFTQKELAKKVIGVYTRTADPEVLEVTWQYAVDYVEKIPYPTREGLRETLAQSTHPRARTAQPDMFVDDRLVQELEQQGFFKRLWGK